MKTLPILMPQMGQSVAEGTIVAWRKRVGDAVAADEVIMDVESDKITVAVESPVAGRLSSILKGEGQRAAVGDVVGMIECEGADESSAIRPTEEPPRETRAAMGSRSWCVSRRMIAGWIPPICRSLPAIGFPPWCCGWPC